MRANLMIIIAAVVNLSSAATAFADHVHYEQNPVARYPEQSNAAMQSSRTYASDQASPGLNTVLPSIQPPLHEAPSRLPNDFNWLAGGGG